MNLFSALKVYFSLLEFLFEKGNVRIMIYPLNINYFFESVSTYCIYLL